MRITPGIEASIANANLEPTRNKFKKAAEGIEQVFLKQLLAQMRQVSITGEKDSHGMSMYKDMMDEALATSISQRGDFGIASQLKRTVEPMMLRQEIANVRLHTRQAIHDEEQKAEAEIQPMLKKI